MKILTLALCLATAATSNAAVAPPATQSNSETPAEISIAPSPGHEFDDCSGAAWCPQMVVVTAGEFLMGSPSTEAGRSADEMQRPVATPTLAIGKFPITRAQWAEFATATNRPATPGYCVHAPAKQASWMNPGYPQSDDHPVVCITWSEARDYTAWLTQRTGHTYRLLTESEWEDAARAGTTTPYPWGNEPSHDYANYGQDQCCGPATSGRDKWEYTSPVGSFPPNAFGLFDMHGNVSEWVEDCHSGTVAPLPLNSTAAEPADCQRRVARGGAYSNPPHMIRSAARHVAPQPNDEVAIHEYRSAALGLRVARVLTAVNVTPAGSAALPATPAESSPPPPGR